MSQTHRLARLELPGPDIGDISPSPSGRRSPACDATGAVEAMPAAVSGRAFASRVLPEGLTGSRCGAGTHRHWQDLGIAAAEHRTATGLQAGLEQRQAFARFGHVPEGAVAHRPAVMPRGHARVAGTGIAIAKTSARRTIIDPLLQALGAKATGGLLPWPEVGNIVEMRLES